MTCRHIRNHKFQPKINLCPDDELPILRISQRPESAANQPTDTKPKKEISKIFITEISPPSPPTSEISSNSEISEIYLTTDKQTGAPVIVPNAAPQSPPTQSLSKLSPPQSGPQHVALKTKENNQQTIKLVKNEQSGKIQVSQEVTHVSTIW